MARCGDAIKCSGIAVAIRMGSGVRKGANDAFMTAFSLTLLMSAILMVAGMIFSRQIVDLSGEKSLSRRFVGCRYQYLFYNSVFSVSMLIRTCLSVFARNDGSPTLTCSCFFHRMPLSFYLAKSLY